MNGFLAYRSKRNAKTHNTNKLTWTCWTKLTSEEKKNPKDQSNTPLGEDTRT